MATIIDSTGLLRDRLDAIKSNFEAGMRGIYGADIDVTPSSKDGQAIGIWSEAIDSVGQVLEEVYLSRSVAGAAGASLSRLVVLNGIKQNVASFSKAPAKHTGVPGTFIPDGSLVDTTATPPGHFHTLGDATIGSDGTALGTLQATTMGPVFGALGTISVQKTIISGWTSVTNTSDVVLGSDVEKDPPLRARRAPSVALFAKSVIDAIYARVFNIQGVSQAVVIENKTGIPIQRTGSPDLPPNAINVIVRGGLDSDIATAIFQTASAGVTLIGATSAVAVDAQGVSQTILFDRPIQTAIYVTILIRTSIGAPIPNAAKELGIKQALVDFGTSVASLGSPVIYGSLFAPLQAALGSSVLATVIRFFLSHTSTSDLSGTSDLSVPFNGIASWDLGRIRILYTSSNPI